MAVNILTTDDLQKFKEELFVELRQTLGKQDLGQRTYQVDSLLLSALDPWPFEPEVAAGGAPRWRWARSASIRDVGPFET